jgi:hypothetical protein
VCLLGTEKATSFVSPSLVNAKVEFKRESQRQSKMKFNLQKRKILTNCYKKQIYFLHFHFEFALKKK